MYLTSHTCCRFQEDKVHMWMILHDIGNLDHFQYVGQTGHSKKWVIRIWYIKDFEKRK